MNRKIENLSLFIPFILFFFIHFFYLKPLYFIHMDEAKYLSLAANFPSHTLFNCQFYTSHPPIYPYLIRLFSLFTPDYIAGLFLSFISSLFFLLFSYLILRLFLIEYKIICLTLSFLAFSWLSYYYTTLIYKESFFSALLLFSLYFFLAGLKKRRHFYILLSSLGCILGILTSELFLLSLPLFLLILILCRRETKSVGIKWAMIPLVLLFLAYSGWIFVRFSIFKNANLYPAGVDGIVEDTSSFGLKELILPRSFPATQKLIGAHLSTSPLHYIKYLGSLFNLVWPFHYTIKSGSPIKPYFLLLYSLLFTLFLRGFILSLRKRESVGLFFFSLSFFFLTPILAEVSDPRFSLPVVLPVGYFIAKGSTFNKFNKKENISHPFLFFLLSELLFLPFWYLTHPYPLFSLKKEVQLSKTADWLNRQEEDGVMAEFGYPPELAYLTQKRVLGIPLSLHLLEETIQEFNINYIIFGEVKDMGGTLKSPDSPIFNYINSSSNYQLIKVIDEDYQAVDWQERIYIFKRK